MHCTGGTLSSIHALRSSHTCGIDFEDELQAATHESSCQSTSSDGRWRGRCTSTSSIRCSHHAHHACVSRSAAYAHLLAHSCHMEQNDGRFIGPCTALVLLHHATIHPAKQCLTAQGICLAFQGACNRCCWIRAHSAACTEPWAPHLAHSLPCRSYLASTWMLSRYLPHMPCLH